MVSIFYPLISFVSNVFAYAGQGLLEAHALSAIIPAANTIIAILFILFKFLIPKMFIYQLNTKLIQH